jgi:hypothetical protein
MHMSTEYADHGIDLAVVDVRYRPASRRPRTSLRGHLMVAGS